MSSNRFGFVVKNLTSELCQQELVHQDYPPIYSYNDDILVGLGDGTGDQRMNKILEPQSRSVIVALTDRDQTELAIEKIWGSIRHQTVVLIEDIEEMEFPDLNTRIIDDGLEIETKTENIHFHVLETPRTPIIAAEIGEYIFIRDSSEHTKKKEIENGYERQKYIEFYKRLKKRENKNRNVSALGYYNSIENRIEAVKDLQP